MRKQLTKTVENILNIDNKTILLLGDIGVFGFRNIFKKYPDRVYNIGILEQSTIGVSSGLSKSGLIPIVHTIAPFLVERAYEQLKIDFGYQNLNGNFISVGASYDYASLGPTHHCPADVPILKNIPNMQIIVPGTSYEFDQLFNESYNNGHPTYYRLSEYEHDQCLEVKFGKANIIKKGKKATIICIGDMLQNVIIATQDIDLTILYYTTISPFDYETLYNNFNENIIICEPYYEGCLNYDINKISDRKYRLLNIGVPHEFLINYGTKEEHDIHLGFDSISIFNKIINFIC